jgi:hypothetical protein
MSVDNSDVLQAITALTKTVEQYHGDFREFRGTVSTKIETIETEMSDAKEQISKDRLWQRIQIGCVVPVVGVLHQIAEHFHWIGGAGK